MKIPPTESQMRNNIIVLSSCLIGGIVSFICATNAFAEGRSSPGWTEFAVGWFFSILTACCLWVGVASFWELCDQPFIVRILPSFMKKSSERSL